MADRNGNNTGSGQRQPDAQLLPRLQVGIEGFDHITDGGLPKGRATLITGTAGSGKTVFALQFLIEGVRRFDQNGVIVTFEETPEDMVRNVDGLGWGLQELIEKKKIAVVDASPEPGELVVETGGYDLAALLARIEHAVRTVGADRLIIDSVGAIFPQFSDSNTVRRELHRIVAGLRLMDLTSLITVERINDHGELARFGVEEFVADNVIILRNTLDQEKRRRTMEILKFRGATHQKGEFPFTIDTQSGVTVIPLSAIELKQASSNLRISSGNPVLDEMCGGGVFRDSIILVSGATGTGKTLMVTEFLKAGIDAGNRIALFAFEESRQQLTRNATSWGVDLAAAEDSGVLQIYCRYPETMGLEDHLIRIKRDIEAFRPQAIAVDSMSALERVSSARSFREFVISLTSYLKQHEIAGMFTNTTSMLVGSETITESHISTITDSIILLRYVELYGETRRGITVLKMRGSWHDKRIREYTIDETGMTIKEPFKGVHGILAGSPIYSGLAQEQGHLDEMFSRTL